MWAPPGIAVHVEETQVERFSARVRGLDVAVADVAVHAPLIYARCARGDDARELVDHARRAFAHGRIRAHRIYTLQHCCLDPAWIVHSRCVHELRHHGNPVFRVVAYPNTLQPKMTALLASNGIATHPTQHTHELHVVLHSAQSSLTHFGVVLRSPVDEATPNDDAIPHTRAAAPCRAYFKMQESLQYASLARDDLALDIGASPGGWTEALLAHGARVVAVDPGDLTIDVADRPVVHIPMLLEDAMPQLEAMPETFALCVCDINVRVQPMARLILAVAHRLRPGARVILTLKLGKKPTAAAVTQAVEDVQAILAGHFDAFQVRWLHANTQNERTLFAIKR
ncbi:TPA: hypothetical protein N0F65_004780 [Lagenidium giganteum]|uniref:Ribosomal RNA methyltransferase FtsJ domain-containing protein n=1 Tax=Lagenidium giganteum TaxID=4803 RepID=A0AAV2Z8D0_9STRA|nr:TPA: hypothetical protein N0F65_004780 [Lagenidium giganteum]